MGQQHLHCYKFHDVQVILYTATCEVKLHQWSWLAITTYAAMQNPHFSFVIDVYQKLSTVQRVGLGVHTSGLSREQDDQVRSLRSCFLASLHTPTGLPHRRPRIVIRTRLSLLARTFGRIGSCACLSWHSRPTQQYGSFVIQLAKQIVQRYYVYF
jgi:hypothetical protein